jgi:large subunit ribosomal protein L22
MAATAKLRMLRSTPRKTRLVADLIHSKDVTQAEAILRFTDKRAATPLLKLLSSAKANAVNNHDMFEDALFVSEVQFGPVRTGKHYLPRPPDRADLMRKRTCHVSITLEERRG